MTESGVRGARRTQRSRSCGDACSVKAGLGPSPPAGRAARAARGASPAVPDWLEAGEPGTSLTCPRGRNPAARRRGRGSVTITNRSEPCDDGNGEPVPGEPASQGSSPARGAEMGLRGENASMGVTEPPASRPWAPTCHSKEEQEALLELQDPAGGGMAEFLDRSAQGRADLAAQLGAQVLETNLVKARTSKARASALSRERAGGYVGLSNQGSTCYLNSLLQCLFFTPELREAILRSDPVDGSSIVCQLKTLFEQLNWESSKAPSTEEITRCLGVSNVHQQQDVAEYFRILMNKLIEDKQEIRQLYQVEMVHSITCLGCENETPIPETPVLSLSLSLKSTSKLDVFSVHEALHDVQKVNGFTGDEQVYCDGCESKQDATSRYSFETLPPILVLNLKRYRFDGAGFRKLRCKVSVPFSLTVESREQSEVHYELFAMCHHRGGIHGGHYVAEIKPDKSEFWYLFDDTAVCKVPEEQNTTSTKDSSTAYLLMYRTTNSVSGPRSGGACQRNEIKDGDPWGSCSKEKSTSVKKKMKEFCLKFLNSLKKKSKQTTREETTDKGAVMSIRKNKTLP